MRLQWIELEHHWTQLWSMRTSIAGAIWGAAITAWVGSPESWHPDIPEWGKWLVMVSGVSTLVSVPFTRMIQQPNLKPKDQS